MRIGGPMERISNPVLQEYVERTRGAIGLDLIPIRDASVELLARIRALLRRSQAQSTLAERVAEVRAWRFGDWELNVGLRKLRGANGRLVDLTNGEFSLLAALLSAPQRILSRDQLLELSRLHNAEVYDRTIDVQILRLRRKIEDDPSRPRYIRTERGAGYLFDAEVQVLR